MPGPVYPARLKLYNLPSDSGEQQDVAESQRSEVRRLQAVLARLLGLAVQAGRGITGRAAPVPKDIMERLRALGYVD